MSVGDIWTTQENISPVKHNAKDWFSGTGSQIASLPFSQQHNFARCTVAGSGFEADRCYFRNAGQSTWLPFFTKHKHDADTNSAGGELFDILVANLRTIYLVDYQNLQAAFMTSQKTAGEPPAGGAYADVITGSEKYVQLSSANIVDSYSAATAGGLAFDFAAESAMYWKQAMSHNTDILARSGVNLNPANDAPTTRAQYGIENCTGDGTATQLVTANGVTRTKVSTTMTANTIKRGLACIHIPGTNVTFKTDSGFTLSKTTSIPSSGLAEEDDVLTFSVRTTNTTIKTLKLWAIFFAGKIGDTAWVKT